MTHGCAGEVSQSLLPEAKWCSIPLPAPRLLNKALLKILVSILPAQFFCGLHVQWWMDQEVCEFGVRHLSLCFWCRKGTWSAEELPGLKDVEGVFLLMFPI